MDGDRQTADPAARELLDKMSADQIQTAWDRAEKQKGCKFGKEGICCRICSMGPCRIIKKGDEETLGVCGANADTVVSRNFLRAVCGGAAAHSDHGRAVAETLLAIAEGRAKGYTIKDPVKLRAVAAHLKVEIGDKDDLTLAKEVAHVALGEFGRQEGEGLMAQRAPEPRLAIWRKLGIMPRGIDREIVEAMHRTHMGVDQDYRNIMRQTSRTALGDGWGGSMLGTELQDVMFGTPVPARGKVNLGVLRDDMVNVVVHGHEPILSEMIASASQDPELVERAKKVGAKGINIAGICCTANELLMRHGIPIAGNFLQQELALGTGAIEMMLVDVQCVMQALGKLSGHYHTKLVTTTEKSHIPGARAVAMTEENAYDMARELLAEAVDNYPNRREVHIPKETRDVVVGFSHETINYMLGGRFRQSYRPLNDNIMNGRIRGIAALVGCNNVRTAHDESHTTMAKELIKNDILVVTTGCCQIASGKKDLMTPEAKELAGPGLREVCETVGMPPVLACGSCVDNSRLLVACTEMVREGGLGDDLSDLPVAGACLEAMSEKAISIGQYFVASGLLVVFGETLPIRGSDNMQKLMFEEFADEMGGRWAIESDPIKAARMMIDHIEQKRDALGINVETERKLFDMEDRRALKV